ncbi:DUF262 domain-containing protein [Paucihalobacter ruber]|uniref:DUF262 domain-containing protein n=1 Tax=Paucihalobacter ruber TaxID=2567861 RepID=A0A506PJV2_9FLAO|nr:DUF262 domain-containing protein [Paucihalobacter ruber]TPV34071.1 DUF262 domain-containing protein [Paucihalobacter ruber]
MKIGQILDKIDDRQIFVPAFQREYVWKRYDAKNLISSLIKEYPTGTMLTWETNNPPELKGDYVYEETKGTVKIILDGQQRITTLYMLMRGEIPPYYTPEEIENDIRNLHVNLETLELEYYKIKTMENNPLWVNITDIFLGGISTRDITDALEHKLGVDRLPKEQEKIISDNFRAIERIEDKDFLEQIIPVRASIKEAIDIFYIVNSSGVNLTDAELALAQISGYWPQARELFKKKLQELEKQGWVFKLDFLVYAILAAVHQMGSKMEKLHGAENKANVQEAWRRLDGEVLDYVCNLLKSQAYVDHSDEINSIYALIPIILYVYQKPSPKLSEEEIKKIVQWFYYTQIRYRYVGQLPQKLDKDLKIIKENPTPFETLLALIAEERPLEIKPSEFVGRDIRHPLFSLMRWYFKSKGAICFGTGFSLRKNMGKKYGLERDHIFAYSVLRDCGHFDMNNQFDYQLAQEITNRAILTQVENREKSAEFADAYLSKVQKQFPTALKLQCIPEDPELWKVENFHSFLEARRKILAGELNEYLNNISIGFSKVSTTVDLLDMIASGEHGYLEFKSSMRWNWRENHQDKKMEEIILKTVAAFSNKDGGKLIIGVTDEGEVIGLEPDYGTLKEPNKDHFELHLKNLVNSAFGKEFGASSLDIRFPIVADTEICEIDIKAGNKPLYVEVADKSGNKSKKFYIRSGNSSQELDIEETASFISKRF